MEVFCFLQYILIHTEDLGVGRKIRSAAYIVFRLNLQNETISGGGPVSLLA